MGKSKAPKVKKISRDKTKFIAEWSTGEKYTDQDANYRLFYYMYVDTPIGRDVLETYGSWSSALNPGKSATSVKFTPTFSEKKTYTKVEFRVRGKGNDKGDTESDYAYGTFKLSPPSAPKITMDRTSSTKTTFNWEVPNVSDTNSKMYDRIRLWTALVMDTTVDKDEDGWLLDDSIWTDVTPSNPGKTSGTYTFGDEETSGWDLVHHSYTRWFKATSYGPGGTGWNSTLGTDVIYSHRTYSANVQPIEEVDTEVEPRTTGGYSITYHFVSPWSTSNPIDSVQLQYCITTPDSTTTDEEGTRKTELSIPAGAGWTTARTITDVKTSTTYPITLDSNIGNDQVVFVRTVTVYEDIENGGAVSIPDGAYGPLPQPTGLVVGVPDPETGRVSVRATNNSNITASFLGVFYRGSSTEEQCIGIIPHNQSGQDVTVVLPSVAEDPTIIVRAYVADYSPIEPGANTYNITNIKMQSGTYQGSGSVPKAPTGINVTRKENTTDTVQVNWTWTWTEANTAEISWSQDPDAWESNNEPSTYMVSNTHSGKWYITGLSAGKWYFKVRLIQQVGDDIYYGAYSDRFGPVKISEVPLTPRLTITPETGIVTVDGSFTCYWVYTSGDGTPQAFAKIFEAMTDPVTGELIRDSGGNIRYYSEPIGTETSGTHITFNVADLGWSSGETHYLSVQVTSLSDETSVGFSTPVKITVATALSPSPPSITFESYSFETVDEYGQTSTVTVEHTLRRLPLTVNVSGAGSGGITTLAIEKSGYVKDILPDGTYADRFDGTVIYLESHNGEAPFVINKEDLIGPLSDGQDYRLMITVQDSIGQVVNLDPVEFTVYWEVQPDFSYAEIEYDNEEVVAYITPIPSEIIPEGATCDIYRISIDRPELIVSNAEYYQTYVDKYPTLGDFGGYRIISKSKYDDWITPDGLMAWTDYYIDSSGLTKFDIFALIIDFDKNQLVLPFDIDVSNTWSKDFEQTSYLGGSVVGDWNKAVTKSTSINLTIPIEYTPDSMKLLTELAEYSGICHVRTPDGSNYYANVSVKENKEKKQVRTKSTVSLEISRVDPPDDEPEGLTYEDWIIQQEV